MNNSMQDVLEEESLFYERYRQSEINNYRNVTFIGSFTMFMLARIFGETIKNDKENVYKLEQFWDNFLCDNTTIIIFIMVRANNTQMFKFIFLKGEMK